MIHLHAITRNSVQIDVVCGHEFQYSNCRSLLCMYRISYPPQKINRWSWFLTAVSQVELGVLHLVDNQNPQITVLVDCEGLTSLGFPMQMMRSCSTLLQDNFPNRLGCLLVIRLPPVARVIAQTVIQVRTLSINKFKFNIILHIIIINQLSCGVVILSMHIF